ncbi:MAG: LCP family protein, partial [Mycobacteriales bacterium]
FQAPAPPPSRPVPPRLPPRGGGPGGPGGPGGRRPPHGRNPAALGAKIVAALASLAVLFYAGIAWSTVNSANSDVHRLNGLNADKVPDNTRHDIDGKDENILLVGNDSRVGYTNKQLAQVATGADGGGFNTDTILVLHIPSNRSKATLISVPRDSYVNIPGFRAGKINGAYADGACYPPGAHTPQCGNVLTKAQQTAGASKLMETISQISGLHIDHYVEVSLLGFYNISNALGGVKVCVKQAVNDPWSGLKLSAGEHRVKGTQALQFVRQRHNFPDGGGDLDRIKRQQAFLGAAANQIISAGTILNPFKAKKFVETVSRSLTVDKSLDLVKLATQLRNIASGNVTFTTMPTQGASSGAGDGLKIDTDVTRAFFAEVAGARTSGSSATGSHAPKKTSKPRPTVPRSEVSVQVLNGSGVRGQAGRASLELRSAGFAITGTADADRTSYQRSVIRYAPGASAQANTVASAVPGAQLVEDASVGGSIVLILGSDFTSINRSGTAPASKSDAPRKSSSSSQTKTQQRTASDSSCVY